MVFDAGVHHRTSEAGEEGRSHVKGKDAGHVLRKTQSVIVVLINLFLKIINKKTEMAIILHVCFSYLYIFLLGNSFVTIFWEEITSSY